MSELPINFQLTEADFLTAFRLHARPNRWQEATQRAAVIVLVASLVGAVLLVAQGDSSMWLTVIALAAALAALFLINRVLFPRAVRRQYQQHKGMQEPITVEMSDEKMIWRAQEDTATVKWPEILKWKSDEHAFLFYMTDTLFRILPKRALAGSDRLAEIYRHLEANQVPDATPLTATVVVRSLLWVIAATLMVVSVGVRWLVLLLG